MNTVFFCSNEKCLYDQHQAPQSHKYSMKMDVKSHRLSQDRKITTPKGQQGKSKEGDQVDPASLIQKLVKIWRFFQALSFF